MPGADQPVSKDDIRTMVTEFADVFDQRLSDTTAEFLEVQTKNTSLLTHMLKESTKVKWRREGNQRQFDFNQPVPAKCFFSYPEFLSRLNNMRPL